MWYDFICLTWLFDNDIAWFNMRCKGRTKWLQSYSKHPRRLKYMLKDGKLGCIQSGYKCCKFTYDCL